MTEAISAADLIERIEYLEAQARRPSRGAAVPVLTPVLLTVIAICLVVLTLRTISIAPVHAATSLSCTGELKANAWGGTEASIGGYRVDIRCSE
jgi:hypothetical protein